MALPKIAKVTHEAIVPSTGKKIKFRPFLVKEEKVLILARESNDQGEMVRGIKDVIEACVLTKQFSTENLATFDIEYLFLSIRGKSIGEDVEVIITCPDDGVTKVTQTIFLDEVKVVFDDEHSDKVKIDDTYSIQMKYPNIETVMGADQEDISIMDSLELITSCISMIFSEDESWAASESSKEELLEWVEDLEPKQFEGIEKFFTTMPKLSHTIQVTNPETKVTSDVVLEGLGSFFA